jgi:hypothetical protein
MASFAALNLIGSVVLTLPGVTIDGGVSYVDAVFTSTSAHAPSLPISFCGCAPFPFNGDVNQGSFSEDWTRGSAFGENLLRTEPQCLGFTGQASI